MVYIEAQDKKLMFGMRKNELQSVLFDWYSIGWKSHISKINKRKKTITYPFETQIASRFFQYLKGIIS